MEDAQRHTAELLSTFSFYVKGNPDKASRSFTYKDAGTLHEHLRKFNEQEINEVLNLGWQDWKKEENREPIMKFFLRAVQRCIEQLMG